MAVHLQAAGMGWGCSLSEPEKEFIWCGWDAGVLEGGVKGAKGSCWQAGPCLMTS